MLKRGLFLLAACAPLGLVMGGCPPTTNECTLDTDCAGDDVCVSGSCVECRTNAQCNAGETCTNGNCAGAQDECDANDDCDEGEICENGDCVPDDGGNGGGDATAGAALYTGNGCNVCHGAEGQGASGPDITGATAAEIFENVSEGGDDPHPVKVENFTMENAEDVAAYLASL